MFILIHGFISNVFLDINTAILRLLWREYGNFALKLVDQFDFPVLMVKFALYLPERRITHCIKSSEPLMLWFVGDLICPAYHELCSTAVVSVLGQCPYSCNFNGDCVDGKCRCLLGYHGHDCRHRKSLVSFTPNCCTCQGLLFSLRSELKSYAFHNAGSCPNNCNGHGKCTAQGVCICENGFTGIDCSTGIYPYIYMFVSSITFINFISDNKCSCMRRTMQPTWRSV